jgi:hypothetical protein
VLLVVPFISAMLLFSWLQKIMLPKYSLNPTQTICRSYHFIWAVSVIALPQPVRSG